jgi:Type IV secretory system Conjugative DNA transfer
MYAYAGVKVDRNAGCRGGCITGATGSGKTLSCIVPRLHSLCVNESGLERPEWLRSRAGREFGRVRSEIREDRKKSMAEISRLTSRRAEARHGAVIGAARLKGIRSATDEGLHGALADIDAQVGRLRHRCDLRDRTLQESSESCRTERYRMYPWGGLVCGEKGNEWEAVEALLRHYGREEDLCILRTRPPSAPPEWTPLARFNLLSMDGIPADTYAKMIVDTGLSVEEAPTRDEFFVPQARDKIAWGIRLIRSARRASGAGAPPTLLSLLEILTVNESYRRYLVRCMTENPLLSEAADFAEARFQLENNYWNQPADQLGGVRGTLYNFLVPFAEPEIAEVFCSDSTFDMRSISGGRVVCIAVPQKFALQRRYVATFLKALVYQVILERFDRRRDEPDWLERNVIVVEQDEWQRHAIRADCEVDVVREAQGAVYAATQSQNAVWARLGGRENAAPLLANLRNRWICQAATGECAEESSQIASGRISRELSFSSGQGSRTTNVSFTERPFLPPRELRTLPPFHVVFVPAEGPWLYRKCIAMPATADGGIPDWWFGDWSPLVWAAQLLGLPETLAGARLRPGRPLIPPWRASAPLRAQLRWLAGFDGTFIITGQMRSRDAARASAPP